MRPRVAALLLAILAVAASNSPAQADKVRVRSLLAKLSVRAEMNTGYDRDKFAHWSDFDGDGCDTRAEVLRAESLIAVTTTSGCTVVTGKWLSVFDQRKWTRASDVDIDHHVALAEAWGSGARRWSSTQRMRFANDLAYPHTLNAMTDELNASKSDRDPSEWFPPKLSCKYVAWWMQVKYRWRLSIDEAERLALKRVVSVASCGDRVVKLAPRAKADPGNGGDGDCDPHYPTVCIPPPPPDLDCSDIPYKNFAVLRPDPHNFDGEGNGVGCEA